ncbi:MAG TPA: YbaK/EbsC family protein [Oscillospiraceae bacterium]|nr:YbaK/EbsC family protein [Oscillospiraceae bacterium]
MPYARKLQAYIQEQQLAAEHLCFTESCHSVAEAAAAVGASSDEFVKNICLIGSDEKLVVAIVRGKDRVDRKKAAQVLGIKSMRMATADEILERTNFPCGGTPSFGFKAIFLMDKRIFTLTEVYTGGGSENSLVKAAPQVLLDANQAEICDIIKI